MTTLPKERLEQLLPILSNLVKTIKSKGKISDAQIKIFLKTISLNEDEWALVEAKKWSELLIDYYETNDHDVKEAVELSLLSIGIPQANVKISLAELKSFQDKPETKSTYPINPEDIPPPELKVSTEKLSFGQIEVGKSKSLSFFVEGSSGIIENEIECLKLNKTRFDSGKEEITATMSGGHEGEIFFDKIFLKTEHETKVILIQAEFASKAVEPEKPVITKKLENTNYGVLQEKLRVLKNQVNYLINENKFDSALQEIGKTYKSADLSNIEDKMFFDEQIKLIRDNISGRKKIIESINLSELTTLIKQAESHANNKEFDKALNLLGDFKINNAQINKAEILRQLESSESKVRSEKQQYENTKQKKVPPIISNQAGSNENKQNNTPVNSNQTKVNTTVPALSVKKNNKTLKYLFVGLAFFLGFGVYSLSISKNNVKEEKPLEVTVTPSPENITKKEKEDKPKSAAIDVLRISPSAKPVEVKTVATSEPKPEPVKINTVKVNVTKPVTKPVYKPTPKPVVKVATPKPAYIPKPVSKPVYNPTPRPKSTQDYNKEIRDLERKLDEIKLQELKNKLDNMN